MWVNQLSAEGCVNEVNIFGAGVSGIGPFPKYRSIGY